MIQRGIHDFTPEQAQRIYAWARYVYWAEVECEQWNAFEPAPAEPTFGQSRVLMLQFYDALWVAVEGWEHCPLADETVDDLLTDPAFEDNVGLLRRFRNGVYHYQADLLNERLLGFLREGEHAITWAFLLHSEFKRVVWEVAHPAGLPLGLQRDFAETTRGIVGWLPTCLPEAAPHQAAEQYREVAEMIMRTGGRNTAEAKELLAAVNRARFVAHEADAGWNQQKCAMIETLKKQKRKPATDTT